VVMSQLLAERQRHWAARRLHAQVQARHLLLSCAISSSLMLINGSIGLRVVVFLSNPGLLGWKSGSFRF
jgi:hypothetical protein